MRVIELLLLAFRFDIVLSRYCLFVSFVYQRAGCCELHRVIVACHRDVCSTCVACLAVVRASHYCRASSIMLVVTGVSVARVGLGAVRASPCCVSPDGYVN